MNRPLPDSAAATLKTATTRHPITDYSPSLAPTGLAETELGNSALNTLKAALDGHSEAAERARAIMQDADLTDEAKRRRAGELLAEARAKLEEQAAEALAPARRRLEAAREKLADARRPEDPSSASEALLAELRLQRTIAELGRLDRKGRRQWLNQTVRDGDPAVLRALERSPSLVADLEGGIGTLETARERLLEVQHPDTLGAMREAEQQVQALEFVARRVPDAAGRIEGDLSPEAEQARRRAELDAKKAAMREALGLKADGWLMPALETTDAADLRRTTGADQADQPVQKNQAPTLS